MTEATPTIITVISMAVATLGALGTAAFTYLASRDKLRFDSRMAQMEAGIATMQKLLDECEKDKGRMRAEMDRAMESASLAKIQASRLEGNLAGANQQIEDLRAEVNELRDRLAEVYGDRDRDRNTS